MQRHRMRRVIEPHLRLDAERAGEDIRTAGAALLAHVVGGQACQSLAAQPIGARVADVHQMRNAPA